MNPADASAKPNTTFAPSPEETFSEIAAAFQALVEMFENSAGPGSYRCYVLERVDGELVFRQTEADAALEAAIDAVWEPSPRTRARRRIIKFMQITHC